MADEKPSIAITWGGETEMSAEEWDRLFEDAVPVSPDGGAFDVYPSALKHMKPQAGGLATLDLGDMPVYTAEPTDMRYLHVFGVGTFDLKEGEDDKPSHRIEIV